MADISRELGLLAHLWMESETVRGAYTAIDLDRGTVSSAMLDDRGFAAPGETRTGPAVLPEVTRILGELPAFARMDITQALGDAELMRACKDRVNTAIACRDDAAVCLQSDGAPITWRALSDAFAALEPAMRELSAMAAETLGGREEKEHLILYGACAGFYPLELLFRRALRSLPPDDMSLVFPDPLLRVISDDGTLAARGTAHVDEHRIRWGGPAAPVSVSLRLISRENGEAETVRLAEKGQRPEELPGPTAPFFASADAALQLDIGGRTRVYRLPERFSDRVITARAVLSEDDTLSVCLCDTEQPERNDTIEIKQNRGDHRNG